MEQKDIESKLGNVETELHELKDKINQTFGITTGNGQFLIYIIEAIDKIHKEITQIQNDIASLKNS